jgi:Metal-sensitive transcriptional repressor
VGREAPPKRRRPLAHRTISGSLSAGGPSTLALREELTQIAATRAALEQISLDLLNGNARHCMLGEGEAPEDPQAQVEELMGAVGRLVTS